MRFASPVLLMLLLGLPVLAMFVAIALGRKKKLLERFGDFPLIMKNAPHLSFARQGGKAALLLVGFALIILALSRLQFGTHMELMKRQGVDIGIALDVSNSMLAADMKPNRLEKAKQQIQGMIDRLKGDRIGLVAFAGEAFVQCPLTLDYAAARLLLTAMDNNSLSIQGTSLSSAIETSRTLYNQAERQYKVLILLTDGEDHEGGVLEEAERARSEGIKIYTVGIGRPEGEPIPIVDRSGNQVGFRKDESGEIVVSRVDEEALQKIALTTGGKYYRASPQEMELDRIFDDIESMEKKELEGTLVTRYDDRFQWPLILGVLCIIGEFFISERRRFKRVPDKV